MYIYDKIRDDYFEHYSSLITNWLCENRHLNPFEIGVVLLQNQDFNTGIPIRIYSQTSYGRQTIFDLEISYADAITLGIFDQDGNLLFGEFVLCGEACIKKFFAD